MMVTVRIPAPLQQFCDGNAEISVDAGTVEDVIREVGGRYPLLRHAITVETGEIRMYVNVFVNAENIRTLSRLKTPLREGDIIHILPSVAGG